MVKVICCISKLETFVNTYNTCTDMFLLRKLLQFIVAKIYTHNNKDALQHVKITSSHNKTVVI